jgi:HEPN domain-containing protein
VVNERINCFQVFFGGPHKTKMSPRELLFKKDYAAELLRIAAGDLASASALLNSGEGRVENICFFGQQCVEKSIKAIICAEGKPFLNTNNLDVLIGSVSEYEKIPHWQNIGSLTQYALIRRYEQGFEILDANDLQLVISVATDVLAHAKTRI